MKTIYLAHPYGGDCRNLEKAVDWLRWLERRYECVVISKWIGYCMDHPENPENRAKGLTMDYEECMQCDAVALCGPMVSPGMTHETRDHRCKVYLTTLGLEYPPSPHFPEALRKADALMAAAGIERRR